MESVSESEPPTNPNASSIPTRVNKVPPFLSKTYDMVDDPSTNEIVSWSSGNNSFVVWNVHEFSKVLLPKYFKHSNFTSFFRQLITYSFTKVDPDRLEFANEGFLRGQKQLLKGIVNKRAYQNQQQNQVQKSSIGACVEVGKFGIEEEMERLKRVKNVLMEELVRLRQQQQATEHQLQSVGQKVQVMEQRQQQMISFLAKAVQCPGVLNLTVQQKNDSKRHIRGSNKKRRLLGDEQEKCGGQGAIGVDHQPSINEAAQTMPRQFLNSTSSPQYEPALNDLGDFRLDDVPSSNSVDNGNASSRVSGVTLAEVSSTSAHSAMSPTPIASLSHHGQASLVHPNIGPNPTQGVAAEAAWRPESDLVGCEEGGNGLWFDPTMAVLDRSFELESDAISLEGNVKMDEPLDEDPKVFVYQDPFWAQFFADESPVIEDTDGTLHGSVENNHLGMERRTEQVGQEATTIETPYLPDETSSSDNRGNVDPQESSEGAVIEGGVEDDVFNSSNLYVLTWRCTRNFF